MRAPDVDRGRLSGVATAPGVGVGRIVHAPGPAAGGRHGVDAGVVLVAADLAPGDVTSLDPAVVQAVATAAGAPLSHAAILVRSLGIPAVTGVGAALLDVPDGTPVLVDGDTGVVHLAPAPALVEAAVARRRADDRRRDEALRSATGPAVTLDGHEIPVLANVGGAADTRAAVRDGADGVGMLRTEFAFLNRTGPPGEQEQYEAYRGVADALGERPLVLRTLDLGADIPAWGGIPEPNPALGNRGIRFTLAAPELTADAFAPHLDFFAVGTNDLTQYALAADRANSAVAGIADGLHPAVLRLLRDVTAAGRRSGRPVGTVGELGSDPLAVAVLLGLGVTTLSVRPNAVAAVKQVVRSVAMEEARAVAEEAVAAESATAVRDLVSQRWDRLTGPG